jgi:hypothetical protein
MTPIADATGLFAPRLLGWLAARGCCGIGWEPPPDVLPRGEGTAAPRIFAFDAGCVPAEPRMLHLRFRPGVGLSMDEQTAIAAYLAVLMPLLPDADPGQPATVTLTREALLAVEHRLRNHLNSLLMNAGMLAMGAGHGPATDPFVEQMEADGQDCLAVLRLLVDPGA